MSLDKFYTKDSIVIDCLSWLSQFFNLKDICFLEPSAGNGAFIKHLLNFEAYDIEPENKLIKKENFLQINSVLADFSIGNPPFGKKSKLAIDFFNHCADLTEAIAFVLPVSFMKWSVQKELNQNFKLAKWFYLPENSFLDKNKDYNIRCVFQLWVKDGGKYDLNFKNFRLKKSPPIKHPDFLIWQYNATQQSIKTVEEDWTIATYRQGYHDYNNLFEKKDYDYIKEKMTGTKKQQFFFIKPKNSSIEEKIRKMDFNALAERNTLTPGFGKADFVSYYQELYESGSQV